MQFHPDPYISNFQFKEFHKVDCNLHIPTPLSVISCSNKVVYSYPQSPSKSSQHIMLFFYKHFLKYGVI